MSKRAHAIYQKKRAHTINFKNNRIAIIPMPVAAIRIVGVDVKDDKLYKVLVQNIGDTDLEDAGCRTCWAICIKRGDGSIVTPSVSDISSNSYKLYKNEVLEIHVEPTRLYLQSGSVTITVNGPERTSASYAIEP